MATQEQPRASGVTAVSGSGDSAIAISAPTDANPVHQRGLTHEAKGEWEEAKKAFLEASRLGHASALYRCGFYAERGIGGEVDGVRAREFYEKAAEAGQVDAYAALARMYIQGEVVDPDRRVAEQYIEKGLQAGSVEALFLKGVTTLDTDVTGAVDCIRQAAEKGNVNAQQLMARLYREGIGVPSDEQKALEWARLAAANGSAGAQVDLAELLLTSKLLSFPASANASVVEATDNLLAAEAQQNARASSELLRAAMAKRSWSKEDLLDVRRLSMQAFEQGDKRTAFGVAMTYMFTREEDRAKEWLAKGSEAKDWRCTYAYELVQSGRDLKSAVGMAAKAKREDYVRYRVEKTTTDNSGALEPVPIRMPNPVFPAGLAVLGMKGSVLAEFVVNADGVPSDIKVINATHPELVNAVTAAITDWRFKPGMRNGKTALYKVRVPIEFQSLK